MILCVTPNIALDRTLVVPGYGVGGVFRPQQTVVTIGGKGINVARIIKLLGGHARCLGFIAGYTGALVSSFATHEGLDCIWTRLESGETRTCTILVDPSLERTTVVNEPGVMTTAVDWARLRDELIISAADATTICFCGSLPPGSSLDVFTGLLAELVAMGKSVWVDTSGSPLSAVMSVPGVHVKINDEEAAALLDISITTLEEAAAGAALLADRQSVAAVITMGKHGAALSNGKESWYAVPPPVKVISAVGSGDSFLAGLLVALESGETPDQALRRGTAAGAANAMSIGGGQFALDNFEVMLSSTLVAELHIT